MSPATFHARNTYELAQLAAEILEDGDVRAAEDLYFDCKARLRDSTPKYVASAVATLFEAIQEYKYRWEPSY